MVSDTRSRKWQITINNPIEKGFTHEYIIDTIREFKSVIYYCMSDEVGEQGTFHTHIYIACSNAIRFSSLLNKFNGAHLELARGNSEQNRDYVFKLGKWLNTEKATTNYSDSHYEWGELPVERQGKRNDLDDLYDMIKSGMSDYDIIEACPQYMLNLDKIEHCRQVIKENTYKDTWRDLNTVYIYGDTGAGKTRYVMDKYGYSNVYRVTDYAHPFDSYKGQDVVLFEEFRSSLPISDMLKYLDGYPVEFPARYRNKVACFTKVYICSNIELRSQYSNIQTNEKETWNAFLRRINEVHIFSNDKKTILPTKLYIDSFIDCASHPFAS